MIYTYLILGLLALAIGLVFSNDTKEEFITIEEDIHGDNGEHIIVMMERPLLVGKLFGKRKTKVQYIGKDSEWYRLPDYERTDTLKEQRLSSIWMREKRNKKILNS